MSFLACGIPLLECVYCIGCVRWAWKRCLHTGGHDSETWGIASASEFEPIPRLCRMILAVYEDDLEHPLWAPPGGYGIDPHCVVLRKTYEDTQGQSTPYLIYLDHVNSDIILAIRGFSFAQESDYALMLDNKLGKKAFDGGYVHNGLLKAAGWVLDAECEVLTHLLAEYPDYTLTVAGHSLGSGVAAMLALLVVQNRDTLGHVERKRVRCFAIAPARCMSLNLAVRYADVINSVVLQDDFLPRVGTRLENVFKSLFCLPCVLSIRCMKDTCIPEKNMLKDPRRLYAPGRLYHIVDRKPFRCGTVPPVVKTAVPVEGRFEHIVLSCNATSDHAIILIERETQWALDLMHEKEKIMEIPSTQKMVREATIAREHTEEYQAALQQAVKLEVPDAYYPSVYGTFDENSSRIGDNSPVSTRTKQETWDEFIERVFEQDESGQMVPRRSSPCEVLSGDDSQDSDRYK